MEHWTKLIHDALVKKCRRIGQPYLTAYEAKQTIEKARESINRSQQYSLPKKMSIEDIYKQLETHNDITRANSSVLETEIIIP